MKSKRQKIPYKTKKKVCSLCSYVMEKGAVQLTNGTWVCKDCQEEGLIK